MSKSESCKNFNLSKLIENPRKIKKLKIAFSKNKLSIILPILAIVANVALILSWFFKKRNINKEK